MFFKFWGFRFKVCLTPNPQILCDLVSIPGVSAEYLARTEFEVSTVNPEFFLLLQSLNLVHKLHNMVEAIIFLLKTPDERPAVMSQSLRNAPIGPLQTAMWEVTQWMDGTGCAEMAASPRRQRCDF